MQECLRRARQAGLTWPLPPESDEEELHAMLYPRAAAPPRYPTPDFAAIHAELARKGVTRMLLWKEYKARHPDGCQYSAFCHDYDAWLGRQDAVMRFGTRPATGCSSTTPAGLPVVPAVQAFVSSSRVV